MTDRIAELEKENELLRLQIAARDKFLRETWEIIGSYAMGDTHDMVSKRKVFQAVHKGLKDAGIVCAK